LGVVSGAAGVVAGRFAAGVCPDLGAVEDCAPVAGFAGAVAAGVCCDPEVEDCCARAASADARPIARNAATTMDSFVMDLLSHCFVLTANRGAVSGASSVACVDNGSIVGFHFLLF
jgi:hypothetical protein